MCGHFWLRLAHNNQIMRLRHLSLGSCSGFGILKFRSVFLGNNLKSGRKLMAFRHWFHKVRCHSWWSVRVGSSRPCSARGACLQIRRRKKRGQSSPSFGRQTYHLLNRCSNGRANGPSTRPKTVLYFLYVVFPNNPNWKYPYLNGPVLGVYFRRDMDSWCGVLETNCLWQALLQWLSRADRQWCLDQTNAPFARPGRSRRRIRGRMA